MKTFLFLSFILVGQKLAAQPDTLARYQAALAYLNDNSETIRKEWKKVLGKDEWNDFRSFYKDSMSMRVSKQICFLDITTFSQVVRNPANGIILPNNVMSEYGVNSLEYSRLFRFESYRAKFLDCANCYDSLTKLPPNFLKLGFSNALDNYLMASMAYAPDNNTFGCNNKGKVLLFLFVFDPSERIKNVFFSWLVYR